jgi:hypothetical protein
MAENYFTLSNFRINKSIDKSNKNYIGIRIQTVSKKINKNIFIGRVLCIDNEHYNNDDWNEPIIDFLKYTSENPLNIFFEKYDRIYFQCYIKSDGHLKPLDLYEKNVGDFTITIEYSFI